MNTHEKALQEIADIVLRYHKENGNSPAANHCRNIAIEALAKKSTESDAMKALIELVRLKDHPTTLESAYKLDDFYSYQRKFELAWAAARKLIESKK